jgi:hypothetical protein
VRRTAWQIMLDSERTNVVDAAVSYPERWNKTTVLWLSLKNDAPPRQLLDAGYAVACPKLYLQGATKNPNVYSGRKQGFEDYAGYHYGYNPPLFAERVSDALAAIATIRAGRIIVAGVEGAGAIAVATAALAGSSVREVVVDLEGFRFAKLTNVWDVNFMPGAEKYGDIEALLALCSAKTTQATGPEAVTQAILKRK